MLGKRASSGTPHAPATVPRPDRPAPWSSRRTPWAYLSRPGRRIQDRGVEPVLPLALFGQVREEGAICRPLSPLAAIRPMPVFPGPAPRLDQPPLEQDRERCRTMPARPLDASGSSRTLPAAAKVIGRDERRRSTVSHGRHGAKTGSTDACHSTLEFKDGGGEIGTRDLSVCGFQVRARSSQRVSHGLCSPNFSALSA